MLSACLTNWGLIFSPYVQFNGNCIDFTKESSKRFVLKVSTGLHYFSSKETDVSRGSGVSELFLED